MALDKDDVDPVVEPATDKLHRVARAAISSIPGIGGAALELFSTLIEPPLERRKREWMVQVTEALNDLQANRGIRIEDLQSNEQFFTCLVQASQVALRNHQSEKLEALKNAVCNAALPTAPNDALQQMFLNFIDVCTVWHIRFLNLFQDPKAWAAKAGHQFPGMSVGGRSHVLESAYPELKGNREFYDQIWRDLAQRGFVRADSLHGTMAESGIFQGCTSGLGDQFIKFVESVK